MLVLNGAQNLLTR